MAESAHAVRAPARRNETARAPLCVQHAPVETTVGRREALDYAAMLNARPALTAQRKTEEHLAGRTTSGPMPVQRAPTPNRTGLPERLKQGIEALSGLALDDVRVHYGSSEPAELQALAFTHGSDIHLAPGQDLHLPHEAWHVVQQKQGRVRPTIRVGRVPINDNAALEREADARGAEAARTTTHKPTGVHVLRDSLAIRTSRRVVQRIMNVVWGHNNILSPASLQKMQAVNHALTTMGANLPTNAVLVIEIDHDPDRITMNPAETVLDTQNRIIDITLQRWFIDANSIGEILALLAHEMGVHSLADLQITRRQRAREKRALGRNYAANVAGVNVTQAPRLLADDRRQRDHLSVSRLRADPHNPGQFLPMARLARYTRVMLTLGDAVQGAPHFPTPAAQLEARNDLFRTFLFDVARMMATEDGTAVAIFLQTGRIATVFNWYRTQVIAQYAANHAWLNGVTIGNTTFAALILMLVKMAGKAIWAQRESLQRQVTTGVVSGLTRIGATIRSWFS
jgi:hypothetical protein